MKGPWLWLMLASVVLSGCGSVARIEKGALVGYASTKGQPGYDSLNIDLERRSGKPVPLFCVRLSPQAPPMRSDGLTEAQVARYLPKFQIPHAGSPGTGLRGEWLLPGVQAGDTATAEPGRQAKRPGAAGHPARHAGQDRPSQLQATVCAADLPRAVWRDLR